MQPSPPEVTQAPQQYDRRKMERELKRDDSRLMLAYQRHDRKVDRELKKDRRKLFVALGEFVNMRGDDEGWTHFRKRWPNFFPEWEYAKLQDGSKVSIYTYPEVLNQIWMGGESDPYLDILFGIRPTPKPEDTNPEDMDTTRLSSIPPQSFSLEWKEGTIRYHGGCDFQRALYLLFRESWRARTCEACESKFIAQRVAQRYCSTDCSEKMQREIKRKWWTEHGQAWRQERKESKQKRKGGKNVSKKAR